MEHKPDIFDRLFSVPVLRVFDPFYQKHRQVLLYLFFGGLTTVVSIGSFWLFTSPIPWNALVANLLSWFLAVLFAFLTNRVWVFRDADSRSFAVQMLSFYLARLSTFLVEELILFVCVTCLHLASLPIKIAAQIIVLILNYILSKFWIFHKKA